MDAVAQLRRLFGHESFRPGQQEAVEAAFAGRDALVVMPTGSGKSLCYQLPGLALDGLTIVISPLVALMRDQGDALAAAGHGAARVLNASLPPGEAESVARGAGRRLVLSRPGGARALRRRAFPRGDRGARDRALRGRRGALPERVGPRFPPRLPAAGRRARRHRRALHDGAHRHRHAARRRRHRARAAAATIRCRCARASIAPTSRSTSQRCRASARGSRSWPRDSPIPRRGRPSSTPARAPAARRSQSGCARPISRPRPTTRVSAAPSATLVRRASWPPRTP